MDLNYDDQCRMRFMSTHLVSQSGAGTIVA